MKYEIDGNVVYLIKESSEDIICRIYSLIDRFLENYYLLRINNKSYKELFEYYNYELITKIDSLSLHELKELSSLLTLRKGVRAERGQLLKIVDDIEVLKLSRKGLLK